MIKKSYKYKKSSGLVVKSIKRGKKPGNRQKNRNKKSRSRSRGSKINTKYDGAKRKYNEINLLEDRDCVPSESERLLNAIICGNLEVVRNLYRNNHNLNNIGALGLAVHHEHLPIIEFLLNNKAVDINFINIKSDKAFVSNTALMISVQRRNIEILLYLLQKEADLNIQNQMGNTALHIAVIQDFRSAILFLLMKGADDTITNNAGSTPFNFAYEFARPYANRTLWNEIKTKKLFSDIELFDTTILSASASEKEKNLFTNILNWFNPPTVPLFKFMEEVKNPYDILLQTMSFATDDPDSNFDIDPRFLETDSLTYKSFVTAVENAFATLTPEERLAGISMERFIPLIGFHGKNKTWIISMLYDVLLKDKLKIPSLNKLEIIRTDVDEEDDAKALVVLLPPST